MEEYLAQAPANSRRTLAELRKIIRKAAPDAEEVFSYRMPAYRQNGRLVYIAAFKDHCSLFMASYAVYRRFSAELKPFQAGKATLRFTGEQPLPAGLITRMVKARVEENSLRASRKVPRPPRRR